MKSMFGTRARGWRLLALGLLTAGGLVTATAAPAGADACYNTNWSSYSPPKTFIGYQTSQWYNDGAVGDQKYKRQFGYHNGEYKYRQYNCNTEVGTFYLIQYREQTCAYLTCSSATSWYNQRWSGPNVRQGLLQNGILVTW